MTIQQLKLAIIQAITECKDPELLRTILGMLQQLSDSEKASSTDGNTLLAALLGETKTKPSAPPSDSDLRDLQDSIDEVFG